MSNHENKPRNEPATAGKPSLRKNRPRRLPTEYRQLLLTVAEEHNQKFRALFLSDPTLKDRGARLYRARLLPRPARAGAPRKEHVTKAVELRLAGWSWPNICEAIWPDFRKGARYRQQHVSDRLQHSVRGRLARCRPEEKTASTNLR